MSANEKKFPPPRPKEAFAPYRKAAPAPPPLLAIQPKSAPIIEAPKPHDLLADLEKVEIDPRALEEARSSNRAWGTAGIVIGLAMIVFSVSMDVAMWRSGHASSRFFFMPGIGFVLLSYGIRKWRQRGIDL